MRSITGTLTLAAAVLAAVAADAQPRPRVRVADESLHCPSIAGAFVGLLAPDRGLLLLSAAPFPGAAAVGEADGGPRTVTVAGRTWSLAGVGGVDGRADLWAAAWPFDGAGGRGCVAFEKTRFSSEGDLASYLRWLAERVYLRLPASARERWPALHLGEDRVRLRVEQDGAAPVTIAAREGTVAALQAPGGAGRILLTPFVLDPASTTVAVRIARSGERYFAPGATEDVAFVVASPGRPAAVAEPSLTVEPLPPSP